MNPGATARPAASTSRSPRPLTAPTSAIRPFAIARSPGRAGPPVPSTMRPPRITRSCAMLILPVGSDRTTPRDPPAGGSRPPPAGLVVGRRGRCEDEARSAPAVAGGSRQGDPNDGLPAPAPPVAAGPAPARPVARGGRRSAGRPAGRLRPWQRRHRRPVAGADLALRIQRLPARPPSRDRPEVPPGPLGRRQAAGRPLFDRGRDEGAGGL